ncbi:unnamed protein product [Clonostachys rosea f. rosea IK726]|uniref:FAD-binding domain-containing protein n=2 Tax=Bionectria ochroleuca TaxID=29856 RepID=A0A0B7K0X9_BIOOC|nr:unnamed protein product [Clonostachys rosea f. rosea IK726]
MGPTNFRVIVVGGGPVGLSCAHALSQAGIDFIILEQRSSFVIDAGANLILVPMSMRVLAQLGLLEELKQVSSPLNIINRMDHSGRRLGSMKWFLYDNEYFGAYPRVISRHDLTKVLYQSLPTDTLPNLLTKKKVSGISTTTEGVSITCTDGTSYEGSVVIGADGAHSFVRERMRHLAIDNESPFLNEEKPFLTTYRCLWTRFPATKGLPPGTTWETHGEKLATQLFAGDDTIVMCIYESLDEPTSDRCRYSKEDEEALIGRWGHLPLTPGQTLTIRDAYESRIQSGLVNLEEGVVKHWSWGGRIVLAGDAAHKFTPSTGAGFNNGIIDVVALANELCKELQVARTEALDLAAEPERAKVVAAFKAYEASRKEPVIEGCKLAGNATAMATWQNWILKFIDRYIFSMHVVQMFLSSQQASRTAQAPVFDFLDGEEELVGTVPWSVPLKMKSGRIE